SFTRATQWVARIRPKAASGVDASGGPLPGRRRSPERVSRVRFAYPGYAAGGKPAARGDASGLASALARQGRGALRLPGLRSAAAAPQRVATRHASPAPWYGRGAVRFAYPGYAVGSPDKAEGRIRGGRQRWPASRASSQSGTCVPGALRLPGLRSAAAAPQRVATRHASPAPWHGRGAVRFAYPRYAVGSPDKAEGRIRGGRQRCPASRASSQSGTCVPGAYPGYATSSRVARIRPKAASGVGASGARLPGRRRSPERVSRVRFAYPGYATTQRGGGYAARGDASCLASALARQGRGALRLPGLRSG